MGTKRIDKKEDLKKQPHYTDLGIEPVEVIPEWVEDYPSYLKGCVISYIGRHRITKNKKDLKKAQVYLEWLVKELE